MSVYISSNGLKKLVEEFNFLHKTERPRITAEVAYAASLGDRSENSEYLYGKQRLREIDRRLRFLKGRLDILQPVDPTRFSGDTVLFGATVTFEDEEGEEHTWTILGEDEVDTQAKILSYVSPIGKALLGRKLGETVGFDSPKGKREITITEVRFPKE